MEYKDASNGNTQVRYKYLKMVLKNSTGVNVLQKTATQNKNDKSALLFIPEDES